jgi:hypothetical protein
MIINHSVNTNSFIYCSVYQSPHEQTNYYNAGNGHFHESIYLIEGTATYAFADTLESQGAEEFKTLESDILTDISDSQGKYVITKTGSTGASMFMLNPIPETKQLGVEIVKGVSTKEITAGVKRITVICLTGPIIIKGKTLSSMQYAVVFANTSATLTLPENSVCALVTG